MSKAADIQAQLEQTRAQLAAVQSQLAQLGQAGACDASLTWWEFLEAQTPSQGERVMRIILGGVFQRAAYFRPYADELRQELRLMLWQRRCKFDPSTVLDQRIAYVHKCCTNHLMMKGNRLACAVSAPEAYGSISLATLNKQGVRDPQTFAALSAARRSGWSSAGVDELLDFKAPELNSETLAAWAQIEGSLRPGEADPDLGAIVLSTMGASASTSAAAIEDMPLPEPLLREARRSQRLAALERVKSRLDGKTVQLARRLIEGESLGEALAAAGKRTVGSSLDKLVAALGETG